MTQPVTEKKRPPLKWIVPIPTNEGGSFGRPSLCAACRGNDVMAVILNYFVYEASTEAEQKKIDTLKVQYIQLKRTHDEILKGIHPSRISKKTLIDHMHKLETWGFLKVDGYHHIYEVFFPAITEAMKTPPPAEKRKPRGRHVSQKVKSTNLQSSEVKTTNYAVKSTKVEDCTLEQISNLQSEMLNLQSEMSKLQFEMLNLTFAQSAQAASQQVLTPLSEAPRLIDCNRLIESNYVAANAGNDTPSFSLPILDSGSEAVTDETFKVAVLDDWREYKHLPRLTPTIDVMSEVLKRLQRANGYRTAQDEIPSPSPDSVASVDITDDPHTGQLVDRVTTSDMPASLDVVAVSTPSPSQASNDKGKNLPHQDSHPTASTGTSKKNKQPPIAKEAMSNDTRSRVRKPTPDEIAPDIQAVITAYQATFKKVVPVTPKLITAATVLVPLHPTTEQISDVKKFIYKTNPWYKNKGIHLQDVANYWERWQTEQEQQIDLQQERSSTQKDTALHTGSTITPPDPEKEAKMKAALARLKEQEKAAQQYPGMRVAG